MTTRPARILHLDVLKAYAVVLVVFTHVAGPIFNGFERTPPLTWGLFNVLNAVVRTCVPLFVMISGSLYIGDVRDERSITYLKRRFPPILVPFAAWSAIYAVANAGFDGRPLVFGEFVRTALNGPVEYHLWFMYMIVGVFLFAPILKGFAHWARPADLAYAIGLWFVFLILQYAVPSYDNEGPAGMILSFGGYFLLGYALDRRSISTRAAAWLVAVAMAIVTGTSIAAFGMTKAGGYPENHYYGYLYPLVVIHAGAIFLAAQAVNWEKVFSRFVRFAAAIRLLSAEAFNIYLIHLIFITLFTDKHLGFRLSERTGGSALIGVPLTFCAVLAASVVTSLALQRIPLLNRTLVIPTKIRR